MLFQLGILSDVALRDKILLDYLILHKVEIVNIVGDGNCLINAIIAGAKQE